VVTEVDTKIETSLREAISGEFPEHGIIGEEFPAHNPEAEFQWILDPIDGTEQFVSGIPTYGTIVSLHYKNEPVIGLIDHPALNITISAGVGLGIFCNEEKLEQTCSDSNRNDRELRIATAKRSNYMRWSDDSSFFDRLVNRFPSFWVYDCCYSHTAVLLGAAEAMVDYNVKLWDVSPLKVLAEEAGGRYHCLSRRERPGGLVSYSVTFGAPAVVSQIVSIYESALLP
jgi:myo-inositol-1(or 4)-monophosphatase